MLQKVTLRELEGKARSLSVGMQLARELPGPGALREEDGTFLLGDRTTTWLAVQGAGLALKADTRDNRTTATVTLDLPAGGTRDFIVKLPSPVVPAADKAAFLAMDYVASLAVTVKFWNDYLALGAMFRVPEEAVNTLFLRQFMARITAAADDDGRRRAERETRPRHIRTSLTIIQLARRGRLRVRACGLHAL